MKDFKKCLVALVVALSIVAGCIPPTPVTAETLELNYTCTKVAPGNTFTLQLEKHSNAKAVSGVKWVSEDKDVAKISKSGKVTVVGAGVTFVKGSYKGKTYKCKVYSTRGCLGSDVKSKKHTWRTWKVQEAWCELEGYEYQQCIECAAERCITLKPDKNHHDYIDGVCNVCDKEEK